MKTILLVEDNDDIKKGLDYLFMQNSFLLISAKTVQQAKELILNKEYDLIILDVTLPDGNGFDLFSEMKDKINVPVLFLTAKDLEDDIICGLELGAIDYITKPFRNRELILRINNALKFKQDNSKVLHVKNINIFLDSMRIVKNNKEIELTTLEYKIFILLVQNKGIIVTREKILDFICEESGNFVNDNTLTVYIKRIREKLEQDDIIKTIKGIGYRVD